MPTRVQGPRHPGEGGPRVQAWGLGRTLPSKRVSFHEREVRVGMSSAGILINSSDPLDPPHGKLDLDQLPGYGGWTQSQEASRTSRRPKVSAGRPHLFCAL